MKTRIAALAVSIAALVTLAMWAGVSGGREYEIGCYATGLRGRTPSQVHNLTVAMKRINGTVLQPSQVFSFVKTVGPWTADMGYTKAPVSYDGELIRSWGGGVCQTSTTLYNAALVAGLDIVERHRHHWPPRYAPLGRDAAVAYSDIDLKFRNNLAGPITIRGEVKGDRALVRLISTSRPRYRVQIESQIASVSQPSEIFLPRADRASKVVNRGHPGFCVVTYRCFVPAPGGLPANTARRQLVSQDQYPAMNRVVSACRRITDRPGSSP